MPDLPVGTVVSVDPDRGQLTSTAVVEPVVDTATLDVVAVVLSTPKDRPESSSHGLGQVRARISLLSLLRAALVVLAAALSAVVLPRLGSVGPDLVLLVVVPAALLGGPAKGALLGLGAGWAVDLMPPAAATLGVAALTYAAAGAVSGLWHRYGGRSALLPALGHARGDEHRRSHWHPARRHERLARSLGRHRLVDLVDRRCGPGCRTAVDPR